MERIIWGGRETSVVLCLQLYELKYQSHRVDGGKDLPPAKGEKSSLFDFAYYADSGYPPLSTKFLLSMDSSLFPRPYHGRFRRKLRLLILLRPSRFRSLESDGTLPYQSKGVMNIFIALHRETSVHSRLDRILPDNTTVVHCINRQETCLSSQSSLLTSRAASECLVPLYFLCFVQIQAGGPARLRRNGANCVTSTCSLLH